MKTALHIMVTGLDESDIIDKAISAGKLYFDVYNRADLTVQPFDSEAIYIGPTVKAFQASVYVLKTSATDLPVTERS